MTMTLDDAREQLGAWTQAVESPEANRLDVTVAAGDLLAAVAAIRDRGYLSAITGLDHGHAAGKMEVLYHFCAPSSPETLTLRVAIARDGDPSIPSICRLIPAAVVFERELREMFGITISDIPDDSALFLPDGWAKDVFPLRKDAALE